MKITSSIGLVTVLSLILASCGTYSGKDIAKSIDKIQTEETQSWIPLPSNRLVNKENKPENVAVKEYCEQFGYYLKQFNKHIEQMNDFFYAGKKDENTFSIVKQHVQSLHTLSDQMTSIKRPNELLGLDEVNLTTLYEMDLLTSALEEMNLNDERSFQRAKLHYANTVISLSMTEREYLSILTEYGLK